MEALEVIAVPGILLIIWLIFPTYGLHHPHQPRQSVCICTALQALRMRFCHQESGERCRMGSVVVRIGCSIDDRACCVSRRHYQQTADLDQFVVNLDRDRSLQDKVELASNFPWKGNVWAQIASARIRRIMGSARVEKVRKERKTRALKTLQKYCLVLVHSLQLGIFGNR